MALKSLDFIGYSIFWLKTILHGVKKGLGPKKLKYCLFTGLAQGPWPEFGLIWRFGLNFTLFLCKIQDFLPDTDENY